MKSANGIVSYAAPNKQPETQLAKMSIDLKFVKLAADVLKKLVTKQPETFVVSDIQSPSVRVAQIR